MGWGRGLCALSGSLRTLLLCVGLCLSFFVARAQQTDPVVNPHRVTAVAPDSLQTDSLQALPTDYTHGFAPAPLTDRSWFMPVSVFGGYGLDGLAPYGSLYGGDWRLHQGFNAQLSLSASVAFGKHAPRGVGFGQTAAFAYLAPLTSRLSIGAGIYANNMDWGAWRRTDVGLGGMLAYQLTDRINLYAYGSKTFLPRDTYNNQMRRDPFPLFLDQPRDRIGAAAEFKIGNNAMIGVSIERRSY